MAKTSLKRNDVFFVDFNTKKILKALDDAGKNTHQALENAAMRGVPLIAKDFKDFIAQHKVTGATERSLMSIADVRPEWGKKALRKWVGATKKGSQGFSGGISKVIDEQEVMFLEYGFQGDDGLPALMLDIGVWENGTPRQAPTFFIYYSVERHLEEIHAMQREELMKLFKELI